MNQTFQSRLPIELRRAKITTIAEANEFLKSYLKKFNAKFSLHLNSTKSVFEKQPTSEKINQILAILSERKIDNGNSIRYKNKYYLPKTQNDATAYFKRGTTCLIIEAFDGQQFVNILDQIYFLEEIPQTASVSKNFDVSPLCAERKKKHYIPPMSHPWKHASFMNFVAKQKHRENNANV